MTFKRIIIVGVGQMGGSLGKALRPFFKTRIGVDRSGKNLAAALRIGAISGRHRVRQPGDLLRLGLTKDDFVILAVPVASIEAYLKILPKGPLVMDVGSTKEKIVRLAERRGLRFVGAHPIAGCEKSGPEAANPNLFLGKLCLLSCSSSAPAGDVRSVRRLWERLGSRVATIPPKRHDQLLSVLSHLPHAVAYALVIAMGRSAGARNEIRFAFAGLKDTTRIAASSPEMWGDVFLANRQNVLKSLRLFEKEIQRLARFLSRGERKKILGWLSRGQSIRRRI